MTKISVDRTLLVGASYDDFIQALTENANSCRYGIFRLHYESNIGSVTKTDVKVGLFIWIPETSSSIEKMLYFSSRKHSVRTAFAGLEFMVQASDLDGLDYINVREIAMK